ncbi:hypothetical protein V6N12_005187 [Hibiscus sabdariffa]|uniref:Pectin acetylesterase n=1 Tax=Hibiscus sabdariffa TaxID=183260 RepID=A0ABR2CNR0_9ROSI
MKMDMEIVLCLLLLLVFAPWSIYSDERLLVGMTLVQNAAALGAVCLDGSLPAYHLHRGFGAGSNNWILQFEGGGWCNDVSSCLERAKTRRGSTRYMEKFKVFSGILSSNASLNPGFVSLFLGLLSSCMINNIYNLACRFPLEDCFQHPDCKNLTTQQIRGWKEDFYNWNRVKLRYCDGASFSGDGMFDNGTSVLHFRGQKIWEAIIYDLLPRGLSSARMALLSGCSAGGLATFLHCDSLSNMLPKDARVKCLSDAGFFLDEQDISLNYTMRSFYNDLIALQGVEKNLNPNCVRSIQNPKLCFFPQYALNYIKTPYFILNSAYDVFQFHHGLVPPSADLHAHWYHCKFNPAACDATQIDVLQGFRRDMLSALDSFQNNSSSVGMFINSCFAHCQSESQDTWLAVDSPRIHDKTISQAVGDWYFDRKITKEIDCPYPCDKTCHNIIPSPQVSLR